MIFNFRLFDYYFRLFDLLILVYSLYFCNVIKNQLNLFVMKKIENPFRVFVELRNVGSRVVVARVSTSLGFDRPDLSYLSKVILCRLLPAEVLVFPLYDGTYALIPDDECELISCASLFSAEDRDLDSFTGFFELQDGKIHAVEVSLAQSSDARCDYVVGDVRYVRLCGGVSIEVDVDELPEK